MRYDDARVVIDDDDPSRSWLGPLGLVLSSLSHTCCLVNALHKCQHESHHILLGWGAATSTCCMNNDSQPRISHSDQSLRQWDSVTVSSILSGDKHATSVREGK